MLNGRIVVNFNIVWVDARKERVRGRRPVQLAQAQKMAVLELKRPAQAPMRRGLTWSGGEAGDAHGKHHGHPVPAFDGGEDAAAEFVGDVWRSCCVMFNTLLTATAARESPMKNSAHPNVGAWLNRMYDPP